MADRYSELDAFLETATEESFEKLKASVQARLDGMTTDIAPEPAVTRKSILETMVALKFLIAENEDRLAAGLPSRKVSREYFAFAVERAKANGPMMPLRPVMREPE